MLSLTHHGFPTGLLGRGGAYFPAARKWQGARAVERTPGEKLELADLKSEVGRSFHPLAARCYRFTDPATGGRVVFGGDTFYHQRL